MNSLCCYAESVGQGRGQYQCSVLGKSCVFQHWCTITKKYQLTSTASKCFTKIKADKKKEN